MNGTIRQRRANFCRIESFPVEPKAMNIIVDGYKLTLYKLSELAYSDWGQAAEDLTERWTVRQVTHALGPLSKLDGNPTIIPIASCPCPPKLRTSIEVDSKGA